jgi:oxygen-dependent protoporphyrinogen oxidase
MYDAIVVGGGLAGLAAAWELTRQNPDADVLVLEDSDRLGGKLHTRVIDDCTVESGGDSFLMRKPWALELCRELGIEDRLMPTNQAMRKVYILRNGELMAMPKGLRLIIPTDADALRASGLLSPEGTERMLAEVDVPPGPPQSDESLSSFVRRRFGDECMDVLAEPMLAGLFVGDPDDLSLAATFPEYLRMEQEYGSLIRAVERAAQPAGPVTPNPVAGMFATLPGGMQEFIDTLATALPCEKRTNAPVSGLRKTEDAWQLNCNDQELPARQVVLALPMRCAKPLADGFDTELADLLSQQRYVSSGTISFGFNRSDAGDCRELDGYGVIIPSMEKRKIAAMSWTSTKIPQRAPADRLLMRTFVGGHGGEAQLALSDDELIAIGREEIGKLINLHAEPRFAKVSRYIKATPRFAVGHVDRVRAIEAQTATHNGLALCGCDYRGFGIPDTVRNAREAVKKIS